MKNQSVDRVTILFAGDSGDGIQLTGSQFSQTSAFHGNDLKTFPDFPAEIRAPIGTVAGVSGFQIHFGSKDIHTPGDECDVLVVMNAAALKKNLSRLKNRGILILNTSGFDKRNVKLAGYAEDENPMNDLSLANYVNIRMDVTKMTRACLKDFDLGTKEKDRSKNMFVLGFIYWMYNRSLDKTIEFLEEKFSKKRSIADANTAVLKAGYAFGETSETFSNRFEVKPAKLPAGTYRNAIGNQLTAIGLIAAAEKAGMTLFYGGYPITPASDILHEIARHKNFGVKTFQAEDEIAGIGSAIGASFGGALGVTASSGPGIALKGEALGLAIMLELPLVVVNVQRGGPSTGLPTKTEQADLLQAVNGRNGEAPLVVIAASSPSDCFETAFEACRIAVEHMTPVMMLSDGYIANGAEPWRFPKAEDLPEIHPPLAKGPNKGDEYLPYVRDEHLVRSWALPGMAGLEHRVGGLEKEKDTGNVSYDPDNHQEMVRIRAQKVEKVADRIPAQKLDAGAAKGKVLVVGWGSTYGSIKTAVTELIGEGYEVGHMHLRYIKPFAKGVGDILRSYDKVLIPEMNSGQLLQLVRSEFLVDAKGLNKVKGVPFTAAEIKNAVAEIYEN
jgi:2-oxoglutarate ferredoxin oxidoreductase subunit alpha